MKPRPWNDDWTKEKGGSIYKVIFRKRSQLSCHVPAAFAFEDIADVIPTSRENIGYNAY
jgi:hypothetical protein